jgi:hypothetical protein
LKRLLETDGYTVCERLLEPHHRLHDYPLREVAQGQGARLRGVRRPLDPASGTGTIATRDLYSFASGVRLKSNMLATISETVFTTSDAEGRLLSDGTGARQQQIAEALEKGIEGYLSTH